MERLAYYAPTLRDEAFIWCMFQSGSDVSTVCSLNWGHVMKEIANPPMGAVKLKELRRKKEVQALKRRMEERDRNTRRWKRS